jgi:hypothetical protein
VRINRRTFEATTACDSAASIDDSSGWMVTIVAAKPPAGE